MTTSTNDQPIHVDAAALAELVRTSTVPVLVDFYADWCAPCRMMAPVLDRFARNHAGDVVVAKLNTDEAPQAALQHRVRGIPTLVLFLGGAEVDRVVGAAPEAYLENMLATAAD